MTSGSAGTGWLDAADDPDDFVPVEAPRRRVPRPVAAALIVVVIAAGVWMARTTPPSGGDTLSVERSSQAGVAAPDGVEGTTAGARPSSARTTAAVEEARALLALVAAEVEAVRDIAEHADAAPRRLGILADQTARHLAHIGRHRAEGAAHSSADRLAAAYRDHLGHESLVRRLLLVESRARDLSLLDAVHYTAVRDIGVVDLAQARPELERRLVSAVLTPAAVVWAEALLARMDGQDPAVDPVAARTAAMEEWAGVTGGVGGLPATEELAAYVAGLDVDVLRTLRGDRYFDGVLRHLADRGVRVPDTPDASDAPGNHT